VSTAARLGIDRRGITTLSLGHLSVDICQGAVPALLPFLIAHRDYSYAAASGLVLAMTVSSSVVQPIFGHLSDRLSWSWLLPLGVTLGGSGIGLAGVAPTYPLTLAAVAVSGLGVAAYHPEAARFANYLSGERRATGMSLFSVGGNTGFALGPVIVTPLVLALGLSGTLGVAVVPLAAGVLLLRELPRLERFRPGGPAHTSAAPPAQGDRWGAFGLLAGVITARSGVYFGLQTFMPAYLVAALGASTAEANATLALMLISGAAGTLIGGRLADRLGPRAVLLGSLALLSPAVACFLLVGQLPATLIVSLIGFATIASFSVTVVIGQQYLPTRVGLASGVTLGLAIGAGGVIAAALGPIADRHGVTTALWVVACLPALALALAAMLPSDRRG
jgi:MFS transporter, FSR family, fosmidomycin resistance protein